MTKVDPPKFKVGDVVRLRSGGPKMTVTHSLLTLNKNIYCAWFQDDGNLLQGDFPPETLVRVHNHGVIENADGDYEADR